MTRLTILAALAALSFAGAAHAQERSRDYLTPTTTEVCLDVGGATLPVVCKVPASRLDKREDICSCPQGMRTKVAVCAPGQAAPGETVSLNAARREAARDGSLIGDLFQGKPICVAPRG
ncbi:hypothetical protein [Phenylobacterium sp.]|uniref:hypothetical protein n=1 Tax=Phenylobacterium sp. TaxID=1871053 RepID=UPI002730BC23|nr:hypothetical protein [Phenylobacterium sp.]MDP1872911.1 hypothetical protein [Phenylobacterium sp.]MDP3300042.1 hypothetical protein [Phenylobacterium sp.]MDP3489884.1 hypothetical protein [Phenylobacterium sp.]